MTRLLALLLVLVAVPTDAGWYAGAAGSGMGVAAEFLGTIP
jgi:hypothetical protein